ncbi:molybdopterin cofactor-binding domain-containing protein [Roseomonas chloroacetimidivorans]|uniref:xanthine dehydrogenase family protein molybdopterin-binding subunit n=1 Tax=Roseomonas chloroacetimidivorans TaxID=1766656 RepID=UPI003C71AF29
MDGMIPPFARGTAQPPRLSRRGLAVGLGALVLGASLPRRMARAQGAAAPPPGTRLSAFLEIHPDGRFRLLSPFVEGGQGIATTMAQLMGEELDVDPARFEVECAPPGSDYAVVDGMRMTGGSSSTRSSHEIMRRLGATARDMLIRAAAARWKVRPEQLTTENGQVLHRQSGRRLTYAALAGEAMALAPAENPRLRDPKTFRYIGKPVARLDVRDKSTGRAAYSIDKRVDGMLQAAVQHAPRIGAEAGDFQNEDEVRAMPGVHSIHRLKDAVAVVANSWWRARRAVESLKVEWKPGTGGMPEDFSSSGMLAALKAERGAGAVAESKGDPEAALRGAAKVIEAEYDAPYLSHAQLEPPSALARFNPDGTLDLWLPNQMPELFQGAAAQVAGLKPEQVKLHSPMLGGFFGRHFLYDFANPFQQAIQLAKAVNRPVKVIWSREEEFARDAVRPMGFTRFKAGLDANGMPVALQGTVVGEGPIGRYFGAAMGNPPVDPSMVEGIVERPYAIPNKRIDCVKHPQPAVIAFWRSVGHSMNEFFYESFLDEIAAGGGKDPYALRMELLKDSPRQRDLLRTVGDLSGGWKRGPYEAEGGRRARGVALASAFNTEVATIAEVSIAEGEVQVHEVWVAIDPGSVVNPAIITNQVQSAVALGLSSSLLEEVVYERGAPQARNFDTYPILNRARMPRVHVRIIESGAPMGGIGEPGLPGVPPAVANAVAALTGQRVRSLPFSKTRFGAV